MKASSSTPASSSAGISDVDPTWLLAREGPIPSLAREVVTRPEHMFMRDRFSLHTIAHVGSPGKYVARCDVIID